TDARVPGAEGDLLLLDLLRDLLLLLLVELRVDAVGPEEVDRPLRRRLDHVTDLPLDLGLGGDRQVVLLGVAEDRRDLHEAGEERVRAELLGLLALSLGLRPDDLGELAARGLD